MAWLSRVVVQCKTNVVGSQEVNMWCVDSSSLHVNVHILNKRWNKCVKMYILFSVLGLSMSTFSFLFVPSSGDVEGAETR